MSDTTAIQDLMHPDYEAQTTSWDKYRLAFEAGDAFIEEYLSKFSVKESTPDFEARKGYSYCPAYAKAVILEIKNSIFQRMIDVTRVGGSPSYQMAVKGENLGVDLLGNGMDGFIGREVLPELIAMGKVGVFIDKPEVEEGSSKADTKGKRPYLYIYRTEDIRSWRFDDQNKLVSLLLRTTKDIIDENTGCVKDTETRFRLFKVEGPEVNIQLYDEEGTELSDGQKTLKLTRIPFVIFELSQSLLVDISNHQIALLNLASADMNYALKSNTPFYTEQIDYRAHSGHLRSAASDASDDAGTEDQAEKASEKAVNVGSHHGRGYPKGLDRPDFIAPPTAPLEASMEKQRVIRDEIRLLVQLSLSNIEPRRASADSKAADMKGLEAGLSYIGLELSFGERMIAEIWSEYEKTSTVPIIQYPANYELRTDDDRRAEAEELEERLDKTPSQKMKKEISKLVATVLLGNKINAETLTMIHQEIDDAKVIITDAETIRSDHEAGFVGTETASTLRGYPKGEVELAKKDHADRATRVLEAQTDARGINDLGNNPDAGKEEKKESRNTDLEEDTKDKTRGEGQ